jgi:hypothetical protein
MAMLNNVQLQVLDAKDQVLLESLDNSTREEWDGKTTSAALHTCIW